MLNFGYSDAQVLDMRDRGLIRQVIDDAARDAVFYECMPYIAPRSFEDVPGVLYEELRQDVPSSYVEDLLVACRTGNGGYERFVAHLQERFCDSVAAYFARYGAGVVL